MAGEMNGAESLVRTLLAGSVNVCFTNPGTSEMHFVAALDKVPGMRCVLGLFEGVVTGAADGYYRMLGKPASTLLHLGPGLANGLANLHNAKKANSGIVNIVGEHATYHIAHDAPLTSDIEGVAAPMSHWVVCHERSRSKRLRATIREMKEGPSGSAIRSLIPSHRELLRSKAGVVSVTETPGR
jgi:acetolactate synthase-1/2/3 large subunit